MQKNYFDSWPRSWVLLFTSEALQMRIFSSPHEYDNLRIWISLHWNMFLILKLVLMPTNDNEARSESTNHSVAPPLRPRRRRQLHTNKSTQQAAGNMNYNIYFFIRTSGNPHLKRLSCKSQNPGPWLWIKIIFLHTRDTSPSRNSDMPFKSDALLRIY